MIRTLLLFAVLALTALAYQNSLYGQFQFDDTGIQQWLGGKMPAFVQREMGVNHRPLQWMTYKLNFQMGKADPFQYHLTNLIIHLISVALVYFIVLELLGSIEAAGFGALVFGIHPFFTGAVAYIYARGSMMAAMFVFAAILAALKLPLRFGCPSIVALLAFGAASKEEALIAPVFLFGWAVVQRKKALAWASLAACVAGVMAVVVMAPQVGTPLNTTIVNPVWDLVLNYGQGLYLTDHWQAVLNGFSMHTLGNLVMPLWLTADPELVHGGWSWVVSIWIIGALAIAGFSSRAPRFVQFGAWGLLACPILGSLVILVAEPVFEYRAYVLGLGTAILAGGLFAALWRRSSPAALFLGGAAVFAMFIGTMHRNAVWSSNTALWEDGLRKVPNKKRAVLNLSAQYMLAGRHGDAEKILLASLKEYPGFRAGHVNLAAVYIDDSLAAANSNSAVFTSVLKRNCSRGEPHARAGVPVAIAYSYIALCQIADGLYDDAIHNAETSMRLDPQMVFARMVRLSAIKEQGGLEREVTKLEAAVKDKPESLVARITLMLAYRAAGATELADQQNVIVERLRDDPERVDLPEVPEGPQAAAF